MKKIFVVFLVAAILAILPESGNSQSTYYPGFLEFNSIGGGARAAGMGGAFLGLSQGEMAYSWNPAGMIFAEKPSIGIQFLSRADKFSDQHYTESDSFNLLNSYAVDVKRSRFNLSHGGFSVPFEFLGRSWSVGGGYRNIYDMKFEFEGPGLFNSTDKFTQSNGIDAISLAFATPIITNVGLGITVNDYIRGSEANSYYGNSLLLYYSGNPYPDTVDIWINDNAHYSGVNFDIGLMAKISMFSGSVVLHTPYELKQKSKITESFMVPPTPLGLVFRVTETTDFPLGYSIGLAANPMEKLTVAVDYDSKPLSEVEISQNWEMLDLTDTTFSPEWRDISQIRIGAEYLMNTNFAEIPLRIGFRNNPSVERETLENTFFNITYGDQINTNIITFGTGLQFERAWMDLAYQFGSSSYNSTVNFGTEKIFEIQRDYSRLFISAGMFF